MMQANTAVTQFADNTRVVIATDSAKDYGLMLGREGTIKMKCVKQAGVEYYMVRVGRVPFIDEVKVAAVDLELAR